jgi:hypothetical protein
MCACVRASASWVNGLGAVSTTAFRAALAALTPHPARAHSTPSPARRAATPVCPVGSLRTFVARTATSPSAPATSGAWRLWKRSSSRCRRTSPRVSAACCLCWGPSAARTASCACMFSALCGWAGLAWAGLGWPGLAWAGLGWPGLAWAGLGWPGVAWGGLWWPGLGWGGLGFGAQIGNGKVCVEYW